MLLNKISGTNDIVQEKYITISIDKKQKSYKKMNY